MSKTYFPLPVNARYRPKATASSRGVSPARSQRLRIAGRVLPPGPFAGSST